MSDNKIHLPGASGGLTRYDEEYSSRFMLSPFAVLFYVALVAAFVISLKVFWPIG